MLHSVDLVWLKEDLINLLRWLNVSITNISNSLLMKADDCVEHATLFRQHNILLEHAQVLYLLTFIEPYKQEAGDNKITWVIDHYKDYIQGLDQPDIYIPPRIGTELSLTSLKPPLSKPQKNKTHKNKCGHKK